MFKHRYAIAYTVRPNKKTLGSRCVLNVTTNGSLDKQEEQRKVLLMLTKIHRVNPDAIELNTYTLEGREFMPAQWLKDKLSRLFKRAANTLARVR